MTKTQRITNRNSSKNQFIKVPKFIFTDPTLRKMKGDTKSLYILLMDRVSLSIKNNFHNSNGEVYVYFPINQIMEYFDCKKTKAISMLNELQENNLIEKEKSFGKAQKIYVKFITDYQEQEEPIEDTKEEVESKESTNEDLLNNIKKQINYMDLIKNNEQTEVDGVVELMHELITTNKSLWIDGAMKSHSQIIRRLNLLNEKHITQLIYNIHKNQNKIKNLKKYLISALYNSVLFFSNKEVQNTKPVQHKYAHPYRPYHPYMQREYNHQALEQQILKRNRLMALQ